MSSPRISLTQLHQIPAFRNFNDTECSQLLDIAHDQSFAPGDRVIEQGAQSQHLWILLEGKCEVSKESRRDGTVVLAQLEPFSLFGEMSFFSPAPHSATVTAKTPVKLLSIAREEYDDLIHDGVGAAYKLAYNVVESVAGRLRRMDEWISELTANNHVQAEAADKVAKDKQLEWHKFRDKLFDGWNL